MNQSLLPAPPSTSRTVLLWLLTRLAGGILIGLLLSWAADAAAEEQRATTSNLEWGDALGPGVGFVLGLAWGVSFDFFCSLPLLGASAAIGRVLQIPDGFARRRGFLRVVARWQAVPGAVVAAWLSFLYGSFVMLLALLCVVGLYLLVALAVARLLYNYWLADAYVMAE